MSYAVEKLFSAVSTLAINSGTLQQRFADAYLDSLIHISDRHTNELHEDLQNELNSFFGNLKVTLAAQSGNGDRERINEIPDGKVQEYIDKLVSMLHTVARIGLRNT